jgi:hypothetical protein
MLVAGRHAGTVDLDGGVPVPMGPVTSGTAGGPPAQRAPALRARQPIVGGVDDPPGMPIDLVDHHLGDPWLAGCP